MNYQEGPSGYDPIYASLLQKRMGPLAHLGSHRMVLLTIYILIGSGSLAYQTPRIHQKESHYKSKQAWHTTCPVKRNKDLEGFYCSLAY